MLWVIRPTIIWPLLRTITSHIVLRRVREEGKTQKIRILDGGRSAEILISGKQQVFRSETGKLDFCLFFLSVNYCDSITGQTTSNKTELPNIAFVYYKR